MRIALVLFAAALLPACPEDPPPNEGGCVEGWFEPYLRSSDESGADLGCVGDELTAAPLDAACLSLGALEGQTVDHQSSDPVPSVALTVFFDNDLAGAADLSATSSAEGELAGEVPLCQPLAYRADRGDGAWVTVGQHKVVARGTPASYDFRSVANGTVSLITSLLGLPTKDGTGIVFGQAIGCDDEAAVERVQILVRDDECRLAEGFEPGFTTSRLPDPFIGSTSDDGFFFGVNVPPGAWVLEGYVAEGGSHRLVASVPVVVEADRVSLADLRLGRSDGVVTPEECSGCP